MAGTYVAKPAVVSVPDVPSGWDIDWPFPGALPPGYAMDLTLNLVSGATYVPDATHGATVSLRDQIDYGTTEPDGPNEITWTATLDGAAMQLKLDGGVYASFIESTYADIGDFWGAEPTFVFPVTVGDIGKTIVLTASSVNPFTGYVVEDVTANILVSVDLPNLPDDCESVGEKIACEFGQTNLLHTQMAAVADLDCGDGCSVNNPGCGAAGYCRFMDWAPVIAGLSVGNPGFYGRSWRVKRYHRPTDTYTDGSVIFPTGKTGLIACDGTITPSGRDTSGTSGMRFAGEGLGYELHLFVLCSSGYVGDPPVYMRAQTCADVSCE